MTNKTTLNIQFWTPFRIKNLFFVRFLNFYGFFGCDFGRYLGVFLGVRENAYTEPPCRVHIRVHSLGRRRTATV